MRGFSRSKALRAGIALLLLLLSVLVGGRAATSPSVHAPTLAALEEKQTTVLELTAAAATASAAITLLPGDAATPIADKLADLGTHFLVVLCAIYLEKFLLLVTGYAACYLLLPLACILYLLALFLDWEGCKALGRKLFLFGLVIVLVIPVSVKLSDLIEDSYSESITATLEAAKETAQEAEDSTAPQESSTLLSKITEITEGITSAASSLTEKAGQTVNRFLEALAVMLVTSCVIPILVLLFFVWLVKVTFSVNLPLSYRGSVEKAEQAARRSRGKEEQDVL